MVCQLPIYFFAISTPYLSTVYVLCFWLGVALIGRFTCGFVLLTELVHEKYATFVGTALMIGDAAAILYLTFYYRFISSNSIPTIWTGFILNVVTFIAAFWIPESPRWLVSMKQYNEAKRAFHRIAKFNGITDYKIKTFKKEEEGRERNAVERGQGPNTSAGGDESTGDNTNNDKKVENENMEKLDNHDVDIDDVREEQLKEV